MTDGRILIVDDEETFLEATAELLRQEQYACDEALEAQTAADMAQESDYDIVIADIKMPGNSKLEFVRLLEERAPELPVILITGYPSMETAVDSVNLDVLAYLVKPVDMEELLKHVQRGIARRRTRKLAQRMKHRARERVQNLEQIDEDIKVGETQSSSPLEPIFEIAFQNIADSYVDLRQLFSILEGRHPDALSVGLRNDPEKQQLIEALERAIDVIEETKQSFKSKRLAELRRQLESTLDRRALAIGEGVGRAFSFSTTLRSAMRRPIGRRADSSANPCSDRGPISSFIAFPNGSKAALE